MSRTRCIERFISVLDLVASRGYAAPPVTRCGHQRGSERYLEFERERGSQQE
jgi:hypothetical protein